MRCVQDSTVVPHKFRSSEQVETVELDPPQNHTVLYIDDQTAYLMHADTFEQMEVPLSVFGDRAAWLQDGMPVRVRSHNGAPLELTLPARGAYEVVETLTGGREGKSDNVKPAKLANGVSANQYTHGPMHRAALCRAGPSHRTRRPSLPPQVKVRVPHFVSVGDFIVVDTEEGSYVGKHTGGDT